MFSLPLNHEKNKKSSDKDDENEDTRSLLLEMKKEMKTSIERQDVEIKSLTYRLEKVEQALPLNNDDVIIMYK